MSRKVRVSRVQVLLEAFADDGEALVPLQVQPVSYLAQDWPLFDLDDVVAKLQRQLDAEGEDAGASVAEEKPATSE